MEFYACPTGLLVFATPQHTRGKDETPYVCQSQSKAEAICDETHEVIENETLQAGMPRNVQFDNNLCSMVLRSVLSLIQ